MCNCFRNVRFSAPRLNETQLTPRTPRRGRCAASPPSRSSPSSSSSSQPPHPSTRSLRSGRRSCLGATLPPHWTLPPETHRHLLHLLLLLARDLRLPSLPPRCASRLSPPRRSISNHRKEHSRTAGGGIARSTTSTNHPTTTTTTTKVTPLTRRSRPRRHTPPSPRTRSSGRTEYTTSTPASLTQWRRCTCAKVR